MPVQLGTQRSYDRPISAINAPAIDPGETRKNNEASALIYRACLLCQSDRAYCAAISIPVRPDPPPANTLSLPVMTFSIPTLNDSRVTLREVIPADRETYLVYGGQADANWGFGGRKETARPKTPEQADRFLKGRPGRMRWAITVDGRFIGAVSFHDLEETHRRARLVIGIMRADDMNRGLGTEAVKLVLAHGFGETNLHRVDLRVLARNKRAMRAYEKCGFVHEGTERESAFVDGKWEDDVFMSVLEHEFNS